MNKIIWCVCFMALPTMAFSQARFGFKAGGGIAGFIPGKYSDLSINGTGLLTRSLKDDLIIHYQFGIATHIPIALQQKLALGIELYYSGQGNTLRFENLLKEDVSVSYRLGFLRLPVLLRYEFYKGLYINIGPEIAYRIHFGGNVSINENPSESLLEVDFTALDDSFNNVHIFNVYEISATAGLGYRVLDALFIDLRYSYGFNSVYNPNAVSTYTTYPKGTHVSYVANLSVLYLF